MSTNPDIGSTSYNNWDFYNQHVTSDNQQGRFISSETSLVAAAFPSISEGKADQRFTTGKEGLIAAVNTGEVYPIGLLESLGVQQSKQVQRIFEIGSARSYFIPGRVFGQFNIGRTFFNGVSLLRALYAYVTAAYDGKIVQYPLMADILASSNVSNTVPTDLPPNLPSDFKWGNAIEPQRAEAYGVTVTNLKRVAGYNDFLIDLTSDLFSRPFGLAVYTKDNFSRTSNAFYLENCFLQGHQISLSSGSLLIMEGASAQFERAVPIEMKVAV